MSTEEELKMSTEEELKMSTEEELKMSTEEESKRPTEEEFKKAAVEVRKLTKSPGKDDLLKLYGLYKQGTGENYSAVQPPTGFLAFEAKAKYQAWGEVKDVSKEDAQKQYIELVEELKKTHGYQE